jgi:hypothetical protein
LSEENFMPGFQFFSGNVSVADLMPASEYCSGEDTVDCLASSQTAKHAADVMGWAMQYIPGHFLSNFSAATDPLCPSEGGPLPSDASSAGILRYNSTLVSGLERKGFESSLCDGDPGGGWNEQDLIAVTLVPALLVIAFIAAGGLKATAEGRKAVAESCKAAVVNSCKAVAGLFKTANGQEEPDLEVAREAAPLLAPFQNNVM